MKKTFLFASAVAAAVTLWADGASAQATFDAVRQRDTLRCGVGTGTPGFMFPDSQGVWRGFNVDICRAIAVAIWNDPNKVTFVPVTTQQRFPALQAGEVDVLSNNSTNTLTRDTNLGFNFAPTVFYDGQGFLVPRALGVADGKGLNGATVCVQPGTTTELNLTDFFRQNNMQFRPVVIDSAAEIRNAFFSGRCDVYTNDASALLADRSAAATPADWVLLPDRISKEPLAPVVRQDDQRWYDLVKWVVYALIDAEEFGINQANVDTFRNNTDPRIRRLLGDDEGMGQALGVDRFFVYNIIKTLGNYGDMFERHLGRNTPIGLERGLNATWRDGGLLYSPPFR